MYTIVMNPDKHLTKTAIKKIYQNENLVDKLKFIIPRTYEGLDLPTFKTTLVYILPSGEEKTEVLQLSNEIYKENWVCGYLPIDSKLTNVAGEVELRLIFMDPEQRILRSGSTTIVISGVGSTNANTPDVPGEDIPSGDTSLDGFEVIGEDEFLDWLIDANIVEPVADSSGAIYTSNNNEIYVL